MTFLMTPHLGERVQVLVNSNNWGANITDDSFFTSGSRQIGAVSTNRQVLALVCAYANGARTLDEVTIGGFTATQRVIRNSNNLICAIYSYPLATGTSTTITADFGGGDMEVFAYNVVSLACVRDMTPVDTVLTSSAGTVTLSSGAVMDHPAKGYTLAFGFGRTSGSDTLTSSWNAEMTALVDRNFKDTFNSPSYMVSMAEYYGADPLTGINLQFTTNISTAKNLIALSVR